MRLKLWILTDEYGDDGYITACSKTCADVAAEDWPDARLGDWFDYEDDPASECDNAPNCKRRQAS